MSDKRIALITGSNSGIGKETALQFARNGIKTYASMRNMDKGKELTEIAKEVVTKKL